MMMTRNGVAGGVWRPGDGRAEPITCFAEDDDLRRVSGRASAARTQTGSVEAPAAAGARPADGLSSGAQGDHQRNMALERMSGSAAESRV